MAIFKQKVLLEKILENHRKPASQQKSMRQLIIESGYSESEADNPGELLKRASWQEMVERLPMEQIMEKLAKNALQTRSIHGSNNAIDISLKVTGGYAPSKIQVSTEDELTDEELEAKIAETKRKLAEQESQNNSKTDENDSKQVENSSQHDENNTEQV